MTMSLPFLLAAVLLGAAADRAGKSAEPLYGLSDLNKNNESLPPA
jgi:hypothetical protein